MPGHWRQPLFGLLFLLCGSALGAEPTPAELEKLYQPPGLWTWDYWFIRHEGVYHGFHLQLPKTIGVDRRWRDNDPNKHVGHATSTDLVHWTNQGPALVPLASSWNDRHIATGSVIKHDGRWWMLYTSRGTKGHGIGLAVSDDLFEWKRVGDGPVVPMAFQDDPTFAGKPFVSPWQGKQVEWFGLADPYIYPEPIDGWFYLVLNCRVAHADFDSAGCLTTMRSRDLVTWEPVGVLSWPKLFERMETPQIWRHGERWYLYFGAVKAKEMSAELKQKWDAMGRTKNCVYTSNSFSGPFEPLGKWQLDVPGYILKVLEAPDGQDVGLITIRDRLSSPYRVTYPPEGSIVLEPMK